MSKPRKLRLPGNQPHPLTLAAAAGLKAMLDDQNRVMHRGRPVPEINLGKDGDDVGKETPDAGGPSGS